MRDREEQGRIKTRSAVKFPTDWTGKIRITATRSARKLLVLNIAVHLRCHTKNSHYYTAKEISRVSYAEKDKVFMRSTA